MKYLLILCLFSVVAAECHKKEELQCHLMPGDSILMTGRFTSRTEKDGMVLAMRSETSMPLRVEVYPGRQYYILRSQTPEQWPPRIIKLAAYSGSENLKIEVKVSPAQNFHVWINNDYAGFIPFIDGPAPTHVATNHQFNTERLDVSSRCAVNQPIKAFAYDRLKKEENF